VTGNLRATADFRGLYASLLEDWLGGDAEAVLPQLGGVVRPTVLK